MSLFLTLLSSYIVNSSSYCGKIQSLRGKVEVLKLKPEDPKVRIAYKAKKRTKFDCTDVIVTGKSSRAKIRFVNKSILTMGPLSRISVAEHAAEKGKVNVLNLTYGKVRAFFKEEVNSKEKKKNKKPKSVSFKIKTPTAVAGVRGTDFFIGFNPNTRATEQATITGEVEVARVGEKQKVIVKPGQQVQVDVLANTKKLKVEPIKKELAEEIKSTSVLVKNDKEFTSAKAVELLGNPETWKAADLPENFKNIKEEF